MKVKLLTLSVLLISQFGYSQKVDHYCGSAHKMNELRNNPAASKSLLDDKLIRQQEATNGVKSIRGVVYKIPIVFHILHNGGSENISEAQIFNGLDVINRDFSKQNADTAEVIDLFKQRVADIEMEFVLASRAPNGACFRGYTRTQSTMTSAGDDGYAQVDAVRNGNDVYQGNWPSNRYLNVYIIKDAGGAGGYTNLPNNWGGTDMANGIWLLHNQFSEIGTSSTSAGRSLTHEIGHWFNLSHTWGGTNTPGIASNCSEDDGVGDTPTCIGVSGGGCPITQDECGPIANVQNYMDYALGCQTMFTSGQSTRMRNAAISSVGGRNNLWTQLNLEFTGTDAPAPLCTTEFSADRISICSGGTITFTDESYNNANGWTWSFPGGTPNSSTDQNPLITYDTPGLYEVTLEATDGTITDTEVKTSYIRVLANAISLPVYEGFESYTTLDNLQEWGVVNENNDAQFLLSTTVGLSGTKSVVLPNYGQTIGSMDELISQPVDLSVLDPLTDNMTLSFRYAYKRRNTSDDDWLRVYLTSNCGDTWSIRKTLHGVQLGSNTQTNSFTPTSAADWRTIHMTNVTSPFWVDNFRYKFAFEAGGGNNIYIDDINIYQGSPSDDIVDGIAGINELNNISHIAVYPNPTNGELNVSFSIQNDEKTTISIQDVSGKIIQAHLINAINGENVVSIDTQKMGAGIYFMQISVNGTVKTKKFIVE